MLQNISNPRYRAILKPLIYKFDNQKCHICGKIVDYEKVSLDHIIPSAYYFTIGQPRGNDEYWNLRISHARCNSRRGAAKIGGQIRLPLPIDI